MSVLTFEKPTKVTSQPVKPNDGYFAKLIAGEVSRIEVRTTKVCEIVVKVKNRIFFKGGKWNSPDEKMGYEHGYDNVKLSMNGSAHFTYKEWETFKQAIDEAIELAKEKT